jgi:hypothetical protein
MSQDPVRLLDDPSMPDLLREDLAEAVQQPLPAVGTAAALASLQASIKAGGGATAVKAAALTQGSWWSGALVGLGAGLVGAAAIWLAPPLTPPAKLPAPAPLGVEVELEASASAALPSAAPAPRPAPLAASAASPPDRSPAPRPSPLRLARAAEPFEPTSPEEAEIEPYAPTSPSAAVDGPAEELELLVRIKQKASSDPASALTLVEEGHRRFPRGSFYQERESIAILALSQLGRTTEARERAKHFLDAHPQSPYAERLRGLITAPIP